MKTDEIAETKPQRHYTKRRSDVVLFFCMSVIIYVLAFRSESEIAESVLAWAFSLIFGVLGVYQAVGHADLRALSGKQEKK